MWGHDWDEMAQVPVKDALVLGDGPHILFVYGSLKKGFKHNYMLGKSTFLREVETEPNYLLYDTGPFPGMIEVKEGDGRCIEGELYEVTDDCLKSLDKHVPYAYKKKEVKITGENKQVITHIYDQGVGRFLDCGTRWPRE